MDYKNYFRHISKKSLLGAFLFAMALWMYASLSSEYTTLIKLPVEIKLPENRSFEQQPTSSVFVEAKGTGWNLFNLIFFNNSKKIYVDLSQTVINDSIYSIGRSNLLKGVQSFERVELSDVLSDYITIKTGSVTTYSVPVVPDLTVIPADGFSLVGKPQLEPDVIEIRGNDKIVSQIKSWSTKPAVYEDINHIFSDNLELSDSLKGIVRLNRKNVKFNAVIQQTAEVTFDEIRISIRGGSVPKNHVLFPEFISITFRGGISEIVELTPDRVSVTLQYSDIANDKTGILIPKIEFPGNLEVINISPQQIYNYKITRTPVFSKSGL